MSAQYKYIDNNSMLILYPPFRYSLHAVDKWWQKYDIERESDLCCIQVEFTQPFLKPPHLQQPSSTLLISESTMVFGRTLISDNDGNYKGPLMLSLKEG